MIQTLFNIISLILLICLIFFLTHRLATLKHGVYHCLMRRWIWGDKSCHSWLMQNKVYIWYFILDIALIIIFLGLNNQFVKNAVQFRPLVNFIASPLIWLSLLFILHLYEKERDSLLKKL